jgi:DNA-binding NarL/FixJ family response regulator
MTYRTLRELLTPREFQIVALVAQGHVNKEIGGALKVTEHTVKNHLMRIFQKATGCSNRTSLAVRYVREEECAQAVKP